MEREQGSSDENNQTTLYACENRPQRILLCCILIYTNKKVSQVIKLVSFTYYGFYAEVLGFMYSQIKFFRDS